MEADGEVVRLEPRDALARARAEAPLVCHVRATARRLGSDPFAAYDLLELYAFVRPARFCTPTPRGLASALALTMPESLEDAAATLFEAARALLTELSAQSQAARDDALPVAWTMAHAGWSWGACVLAALGYDGEGAVAPRQGAGLQVWQRLPEWQEQPPEPPPGNQSVSDAETRHRLAELLGEDAEPRPQQADYASAVAQAFQPRAEPDTPNFVLAEAGTGVGKTLGYIAPASLWSEKNAGPVWISTYTRNLQSQIDGELDRLFPERREKRRKVVVRKGRENYLCLLNLEETVRGVQAAGASAGVQQAVAAGLMARWTGATRDGDMVGGDFPGWLPDLVGRMRSLGLADRRGECIYSACPHYRKCFIESAVRRARRAEIVVANHALVMIQAALGGGEDGRLPSRYVFDEGHHVFDAADSAFAAHLSGRETQELRRWLLGGEARSRSSRARGLSRRLEDLLGGDPDTTAALEETLHAARALPGEGWHQRIQSDGSAGPCEQFLSAVRQQVYAHVQRPDDPYSLEVELRPVRPEMLDAAETLDAALKDLLEPMKRLLKGLTARLDEEAATLDSDSRRRIDATCRSLERRGVAQVEAWRDMLAALREDESPAVFVDWLMVERHEGRDLDVGFHRHWTDPTMPFAQHLAARAQGLVVTSATLTDGSGDPEADWYAAEVRSGAVHLPRPAFRAGVPSPFDYPNRTRVFVVNDLRTGDLDQMAAAYRELFLAAGGGGLGLFTAISRLRAVHRRIGPALEDAGLPLLSQHVDGLDVSTLVDIFRAEEECCLLGTDAIRDGVDVPGRALRLIVFDRVPWPRPDIRHKARRAVFGGRQYDDMLTRLRLKQAFGRLIRRGDDQGVFVLLDPRMPTRLTGAFPEGVEVVRCGLAEAVAGTRGFLRTD